MYNSIGEMDTGVSPSVPSALIAEAQAWRRHLHKHPELAFREYQTAEFVASQLREFGLAVHRGLAGTGVVGTLSRGTRHRTIAIRADMDALPIEEKTEVSHASSVTGVMHACGHDGHVAIALAAAKACARLPDLNGTVHFVFQPAEENEGGAKRMMDDGLFRLFPCEAIYALHNWPELPVGTCVVRDGPMMAALAVFEIELTGIGCHGAMPHQGSDVLLAASHILSALQSIVSRNIDPMKSGVVSVTQIHGGSTWNVIPGSCTLRGTARCFDGEVYALIANRIGEISRSVAVSLGCQANVRFELRMPVMINDPAEAGRMREIAKLSPLHLNVTDALPSMGSEDFAYMLQEVPGCYLWLGAGQPNGALHSPFYDFNDDLVPIGINLWTSLVRNRLATS